MHRTRGLGNPAPTAASTRQQLLSATAVLRQLRPSQPAYRSQTSAQLQHPLASAVWPRSPVMKSLLLACLSGPWWCLLRGRKEPADERGLAVYTTATALVHVRVSGAMHGVQGHQIAASRSGKLSATSPSGLAAAPPAPKQAAHPLPLAASRCSCLSDTPLGCCCTCRGAVSTLRQGAKQAMRVANKRGSRRVGWRRGGGGGRKAAAECTCSGRDPN